MGRRRLACVALAVLIAGCSDAPLAGKLASIDAAVPCEDRDHDGFGRNCERGYDCNDDDPRQTTQCRSCAQPELGCACQDGAGPVSCFLPDKALEGGDVVCSEGTRQCRNGVWSGCEDVRQYIVSPSPDTQRIIDPNAGKLPCSICDVKCFQIVDNLLADGGVAGGNVTFGPSGGITLLPGDGGTSGTTSDGGTSSLTGCAAMSACCSTLTGSLQTSCEATASSGDDAVCEQERWAYCPSGTVTGPVTGCTLGSGADTDCDGIPDVVDSYPGSPLATTNNQTIFHQLGVGETGQNSIEISFKLRNADVYFLLDMTNTMKEERDNLIASLTTGNVVNCAHLNQCCNRESDPTKRASCQAAVAAYTNRPGQSDDQAACLTEQYTYCPGNVPVDCPDGDSDGQPDNFLKEQGVVGATRCLVGSSWFGAGFARELPVLYDPDGCSGSGCSTQYGNRDEQLFKHVIDMTSDYERVRTALQSMLTNGNYDEPEGGMLALYSVITGKGHYFGINRPSIATRVAATSCAPGSFGYPCFRKDAVPIVVFFTDRPHHNGPNDSSNCQGQGPGCPYDGLSKGSSRDTWTSGSSESASDKQARFVPPSAETFSTAYNAGDVRGQYLSLVGDTRFMVGDYPSAIIGCGADPAAPDALIRFKVSAPPGATGTVAPIPINFHLTKDDVYSSSLYGTWNSSRTNDPSPATEFATVLSVFRGVPDVVSTSIDVGDKKAVAIASGPDSTYLTYTGTTQGPASGPGFLGGISGCAADGLTNQVLFTFRPTANSRVIVDASGSSFPAVVSLHEGLPSTLPNNPNTTDGSSQAIANTNDTFATANAVPSASTTIDGAYLERTGDTNVATIHADYTAPISRYVFAQRTADSAVLTNLSSADGLQVGMQLSSSTSWSAASVRILAVTKDSVTLSANWEGPSDPAPTQLAFIDSLVGCGVDAAGKESVFKFDVATPRRVRIDTEGSTFDTVISLHDAPPPSVVTKSDVSGNGTAPGYSIGDVTNASYTLSDVGSGTTALADSYNYYQCGAAPSSRDAVFDFSLSQPTHLALEATASAWDPIVALFSSRPGTTVTLDNSANQNDNLSAPNAAFDLGDIYGSVDTTVTGSTLSGMKDDWTSSVVGCGANSSGRDSIFKFTPLGKTRARIQVDTSGSWTPVVSIFDDPPPSSSAVTTTALFDATTMALPDSNCLAYSYHDPGSAGPAHTYTVCPSKRYANDANSRCMSAGMSYLASINSAQEQAFLMTTSVPSTSGVNFHIGAVDPEADGTFAWRDGTSLAAYSNWKSGEPDSPGVNTCADLTPDGPWIDGKCSSSGASWSDNAYYICEDDTPAVAPNEDAATAYAIGASGTTVVTGSTRRMSSDYNGAVLLSGCGGTISGGDAVFKLTTGSSTSYTLGVDSAGSSYNVVLGLFEGSVDAAGYKTCDAPGGAALSYALLPSRTYYVVVKGTAATPEGSYKLKFYDSASGAPTGTRLACAQGSSWSGQASFEVDVDANHTYYVVVDHYDALFGAFDLAVHSLYQTIAEVGNAAAANETGASALSLPDPYRSRITVVDTSTAGMSSDYGNGAGAMCTTSPDAPDAVYKFKPSITTNLKFTVKPNDSSLSNVGLGVFDGQPGTSATLHDLNASGNLNEAAASAEAVDLSGPAQLYNGDTSAMSADVDPSLLACGALPNGRDAVFSFHLDKQTSVEIDASASAMTDPVLNLFRSSPLTKPAQVTLENDTKLNADANPSPTPNVTASWLNYGADFSHLSAESQSSVSLAAVNDDAPPAPLQPQVLGDVAGKRFVISGGDTSPMIADYPGNWSCGANDLAPDAIYKLYSSTGGTVHVKAAPESGFDGVIGLFDGTNGLPLRLSDVSSLEEDNACVSPTAPKNLTNATLNAIAALLASAPAIDLNCGNTTAITDDPDGTGPQNVSLVNWCGAQPTTLIQAQPAGPPLVIFVAKSMQIASGSSLRLIGGRPALFAIDGAVGIDGQLSVSPDVANYPGVSGAGADFGCAESRGGNAQSDGTSSGGGGGGGFGTDGGPGGYGSAPTSAAGGLAGAARASLGAEPLIGGCSGGDGALGVHGGLAAGALQISARTGISLGASAAIVADGGDGVPGASGQQGGSGGGSGGAIVLQAPSITYAGSQLSARGGSGGQGTGSSAVNGGSGSTTAAMTGGAGQDSGTSAGGGGGGGGYGNVVTMVSSVSLAPCTVATNESAGTAWPIVLDGTGRQYIERGDTSTMSADHGGMCGVPSSSPDAVYAFTLSKQSIVQIDARASGANAVVGLYNASNLGQAPTPMLLENDDRAAADANPTPTPDAVNTWLAYKGDLMNLTLSSQPQITVDNSGNANETFPTELPDPIDRRVTVENANTSAMSADYLAASCSVPAADPARDAIYRFVPSQSGLVRLSANYTQTGFDPVIALYRGTHQVIDERIGLVSLSDTALSQLNADASSIKVYNDARSILYRGPSSATPDYTINAGDAKTPTSIVRTAASTIPSGSIVSVDYVYDSGAPLPISQQQITTSDLGAAGNPNEDAASAVFVPIPKGHAYVYTGDTTAMSRDVEEALFTCGPPAPGSNDATFDFSLDKTTAVSISSEGSGFDTALALFGSQYTRPSTTLLSSVAPVMQQLYDVDHLPGSPEPGCTAHDYSGVRYWVCATARPWEQAEGKCEAAGLHLVAIESAVENAQLVSYVQPTGKPHHIGFAETVPYTDSWGAWTSGGSGTAGSPVSGRYVHWAANAPNGDGDCLGMTSTGSWDDSDCATPMPYVCELNSAGTPAVPAGSTCGALLAYGGHAYYACTDPLDWSSASTRCSSVGMQLARVNDQSENDQIRALIAGKASWIGGSDSATEGEWLWTDNSGFWIVSYRNWASGEPSQPTLYPGSSMLPNAEGTWVATSFTSDSAPYICEQPVIPASAPVPPTQTNPRDVDVFGPARQFTGSTRGMVSSVAGFMSCADAAAPDAVFRLSLPYTTQLGIDLTGSFAGSVVGLFKDEVSSLGYANAGSLCAASSAVAPQLAATLPPGTYYAVLTAAPTGTTTPGSGTYYVRFDAQTTDPAAFVMANDTLADAVQNPLGGVDGQWLVKVADMTGLSPTISAITPLDMGSGTNANDVTAQPLGSINDNQVVTLNASTVGLMADYPAGSCGATATGADALYSFTAPDADPIQVRLTTDGWPGQIVVYDGSSGAPLDTNSAPAAPISLAPGYTNEARLSAKSVLIGKAQAYLGNLSVMTNDVPAAAFNQSYSAGAGSPTLCNADPAGGDAFFTFSVPASTTQTVEISSAGTAVAQTIALWDSKPFTKPAGMTAAYDDYAQASMPSNLVGAGGDIDDDWVVLRGDTSSLTPYLGYNTFIETADYPHDDSEHALDDVKGQQIVTVNATTSALAADYLASTLQCGGTSDTAPDAVFTFRHSTGGKVRLSLNNPNPAFAPTMSLWRGAPDTAIGINPPETAVPNTNEARSTAFVADAPDAPKVYTGSTASMMNNYLGSTFTQGSAYGTDACVPDAAGNDAFIKFTVPGPGPQQVELSTEAVGAGGFDHTLALWDATPVTTPSASAMSNDTRHAAYLAPIGSIDDDWVVRTATMSILMPGALTSSTPAVVNNDDIQDLGDPIGKVIKVSGDTSAAAVHADYPATTLACSASGTAPDIIYKLRPSANTQLRAAVNNPSSPSFGVSMAVFDGSTGRPERVVDTTPATSTTTYCTSGFNYTPRNINLGGINFSSAPSVSLSCGTTITFNSSTNTFTGYCSGQTQPTPVVQSQTGGPDMVVLPFKSLSLAAGTTIALTGSLPVVFAVEGNASIAGTISASASTTTPGAGGNWSCSGSAGGDGATVLAEKSGAGGGGFGTKGGKGGNSLLGVAGGAGGSTRGGSTLVPLLSGCYGGTGAGCGAPGGAGGGAVQISAGGALSVSGTIAANGGNALTDTACGFLNTTSGTGAGGGSGGAILLEGDTVTTSGATITANGGNGSAGNASGGSGSTSGGSDGNAGNYTGGGGGGGYGRVVVHPGACAPAIETFATAQTVPIGLTQSYTGPSTAMTSDLAGSAFNSGGCSPDAAGPDAFFKFTLTSSTPVQVSAAGSNYNHTLTLFNASQTALTCQDGSSSAGASLTQTLAAGTYYVGIKSRNGGLGGTFALAFRDTGAGGPYASRIACSGSGSVDASLVAGRDYYVVVRATNAGLTGSYNLTLTDIGSVPDFGCGTDLSAPDAYFDFDVSDAGGRNVSIALNESAGYLNGSFQLMRDDPPYDDSSGDTAVSACQTSAGTYSGLSAGKYYVVVRGTSVSGGAGNLPAQISIRDDSGMNALDCVDASASSAGTITRTLQPGTYYAGITSRNGSGGGSYKLLIRDTAVSVGGGGTFLGCADTNLNIDYDIPAGDANALHYVVVKGASGSAAGAYTLSVTDLDSVGDLCDASDPLQGDPSAPDAYYAFDVTDADGGGRDVTVALSSSSALDGVFRLFQAGGTPVGACHDRNSPFTYADLPAGSYYVTLRGKNVASGGADAPFELSISDHDAYGALECRDGAASTGSTITRTLGPGDYWVGIKPQPGQSDPKEYKIQFRDTAEPVQVNAAEVACGTNVVSANVTPGTTYYVLVKGMDASVGGYELAVTDLGGSAGWNCNDDSAAGDAYFEFNVDDPAGRRVTIDTENSALDTVLAIFPKSATIDASGVLACDDDSGATPGSSKITRDLAPGVYYAVVRPKAGIADPNQPFELSIRDESVFSSVACGATDASGKAQIRTTLQPGTYHVVLKGMSGSDHGPYKLRFRDETPYLNAASEVACNDAQDELLYNVSAGKPYYAVVKGAAVNESGPYKLTVENLVARTGMGCGASVASPDAVYRFHLSQDARVQIDTLGSQTGATTPLPTDTVIGLYDVSASYFGTNYAADINNAPVGCDDDSGDAAKGWSKIVANLAGNRDYYVVVKSKTSPWGGSASLPFVVNVKDLDANQPIACADVSSSLLMTQSLPAGDYRVVVSNDSGASGGGPFDVRFRNMSVANGGATQVACADSPEEFTYDVVAGRPYYLIVKGDSVNDSGRYDMVVETAGTGATSMGCGASPTAPDGFFKFEVTKQGPVVIDTDGSTADTVIALYSGNTSVFGTNYAQDANGNVIGCDDDGGTTVGASRIEAELLPGSYYLVVKGKTLGWNQPTQPFHVSIRDSDNTGAISCASSAEGNKRILQTLPAGDYQVVLSSESAAGGAYSLKLRDTALASAENGTRVACVSGGSLTVNNLVGGHEYYLVVKGDGAADSGGYTMTMEDTVSLAAASGNTSVACAVDGSSIDGTYPAGTYYALVTGQTNGASGPYSLSIRDVDALLDQNRLACDDNSGPNRTSVIERDLAAGTHYVVVKGNGAAAQGAYSLHVRDVDAVSDGQLVCGGAAEAERIQYDVKAGQDYTVLLKGGAAAASGAYNIKLYDELGLQSGGGTNLKCQADPQPSTLYGSNWHQKAVDFDLSLTPDLYYVSVKGHKADSKGTFQLQIGEKSARTKSTYTPPTWTEIKDALATSAARVLPVIATGNDTNAFVGAAEEQAKTIALTSHAVRQDGTPIWQKIQKDGRGTGSGLVTGIAEIADYLALDVSLVAVDGPDPGASKFRINVAPVNSPSCVHPHPLVDPVTGVCTPQPGNAAGYSCNTQYQCVPGAAPKFTVTFTNPSDAPVPPNPNDPYGGYHFKLQIIGDKQYLLDEVPVYIIPTNDTTMGPPAGGSGEYQSSGVYMQTIDTASCPTASGSTTVSTDLPNWSDLYYSAAIPEGASIDFELCTKETTSELTSCVWSDGTSATRKKVTVRSKGTCASDSQCQNISGYGNGFCSGGACQFITQPKVAYDVSCAADADCPNGPLGAGEYYISSRCEQTSGALGYGHCVYTSQPVDLASTLLPGEQGLPYARVRVTLHADSTGSQAPTLYQWQLTYFCKSAQ